MYYMSYTHTITSKGQVTIPQPIRQWLGLRPGDRATFTLKPSGEVVIAAPKTLEEVRTMLRTPAGARLSPKEKLVLQGMKKDGHQAFR